MRILDNIIYRAEKFNDVKAQYQLGVIFQTGDRVEPDAEKARHWFELAAELGHEEAARALAGMGVEPEEYQAWDDEDDIEAEEEVAPLPPVIDSVAEEVAVDFRHQASVSQDCPHGHGPLQNWEGNLRCWICGWPDAQSGLNEGSPAHSTIPQPESPPSVMDRKPESLLAGLFGKTSDASAPAGDSEDEKKQSLGLNAVWVVIGIFWILSKSCS